MSSSKKLRFVVFIGLFSALSYIAYFLEVPVGFLFPSAAFLKIDFSDVPALIAGIGMGPIAGVLIQIIKNILHGLFISKEPLWSGEIANLFAGIFYILPIILTIRKLGFQFKYIIISSIGATILMTVAMCFINYYLTLPLYGIGQHEVKMSLLYTAFIPFNILKGIIISIVSMTLYKYVEKPIGNLIKT